MSNVKTLCKLWPHSHLPARHLPEYLPPPPPFEGRIMCSSELKLNGNKKSRTQNTMESLVKTIQEHENISRP